MRARTLVAGTMLALLTAVWSAPAALAADDDGKGKDPAPPASSAPFRSGKQEAEPPSDPPKPKPAEPKPTNPKPADPQPADPKPAPRSPAPNPEQKQQEIAIPQPQASLSVSPRSVKPGGTINADARCSVGQGTLSASRDVSFSGMSGRVGDNAGEGSITVVLRCVNGSKSGQASDSFQVLGKDGPGGPGLHPSLLVEPKVVRPGDRISFNGGCPNGREESLTADDVDIRGNSGIVRDGAREGDHTAVRVCVDGSQREAARDSFRVVRGNGPGNGDPKASLSVSPRVVKQGGTIFANGGCWNSRQDALFADGVDFRGNRGYVYDDAREGDRTVTRVCVNGSKRDVATDTFRVDRGDGWNGDGPRDFWLSDRSGYRGDTVDASVRCRDNSARLESDALDDITLRRDGNRLTGTTHVERDASYGWHRVTVYCDGRGDSMSFRVVRDRDHEKYLDVDPAYGHRGDAIDVHVGCDWSVGRLDSDVLDDIDLDHDGRDWRYSGTTHVQDDAEPGEHTVRIRCGDDTLEESFFVRGEADHGDNSTQDGGDQVTVYPKGGVETGGGPVQDGPLGAALGLTGPTTAGPGGTLVRRSVRR